MAMNKWIFKGRYYANLSILSSQIIVAPLDLSDSDESDESVTCFKWHRDGVCGRRITHYNVIMTEWWPLHISITHCTARDELLCGLKTASDCNRSLNTSLLRTITACKMLDNYAPSLLSVSVSANWSKVIEYYFKRLTRDHRAPDTPRTHRPAIAWLTEWPDKMSDLLRLSNWNRE